MLSCVGSELEEMKCHVRNILTLLSVSCAIAEYRTEVFAGCVSKNTCKDSMDYMETAKQLGEWAAE